MNYTFHWRPAFQALPDMLWGALVTIEVAALSMVLGVILHEIGPPGQVIGNPQQPETATFLKSVL